MCQLLGMNFNQKVNANLSFRGFRKRGKGNPDGWGMAFYPDGRSALVIKEPRNANESQIADFVEQQRNFTSSNFIAHVRLGSVGRVSYSNTHPFVRELFGREYVFAHNGSLSQNAPARPDLQLYYRPVGETDSELAFCCLLSEIRGQQIRQWDKAGYQLLEKLAREVRRFGSFNFLMSDGSKLFAFSSGTLQYVERKAPYGPVKMLDEHYVIDLSEEKNEEQQGVVVASLPLTNEPWKAIPAGTLMVFENGAVVYSGGEQ